MRDDHKFQFNYSGQWAVKKIDSWLLQWISNFLRGDYTGLHVIIAEVVLIYVQPLKIISSLLPVKLLSVSSFLPLDFVACSTTDTYLSFFF